MTTGNGNGNGIDYEHLQFIRPTADWGLLPLSLHDGLVRYIEKGILPGHFLTAVLENNLLNAVQRADAGNRARLADIVKFLFNYVPNGAWGSPSAVERWSAKRREEIDAAP